MLFAKTCLPVDWVSQKNCFVSTVICENPKGTQLVSSDLHSPDFAYAFYINLVL